MNEPPSPGPPGLVLGLDARAILGRVIREQCDANRDCGRVGDYQLLRRLAQGGMGVVYVARQLSLQRIVAVKMIRSGLLATPAEVGRFRREAEAAASLDHPHIVPIYEIGEDEEQHYFSMKLIEGGNLAELIAECEPSRRQSAEWTRRAAGLVATMAHAVHHAHQRGLLHRDVKPTNVLLDDQGEPHLTDFGLAKLVEQHRDLTLTLAVMGTPGYMAPEQAAGNSKELTAAADIYSLGAVLYEMLAGRPPFQSETTLEVLRQVQEREPPSLRKSNPALNRDLETICLKCLQKEPHRRFATAAELAADLERWREGKPVLARPVGPLVKSWLWSRRNPVAAMAGMLLLALASVSTLAAIRLRAQRNETNENLRASLLAQGRVHRLSTLPDRRPQCLRAFEQAAHLRTSMEVRNEAIAALALPALGPPETWYAASLRLHTHERMLTADGERYALFGEREGITVHDRRHGAVLAELVTPPQHMFTGRFSPNGRFLLNYDRAFGVFVWDLSRTGSGPRTHSLAFPGPWERGANFSPDSQALVVAGPDQRVRWFDLESGAEEREIRLPVVAQSLAVSPAGDHLALSAAKGGLFIWKIDPPAEVIRHQHLAEVTALAWHPHGRFVAAGYQNGELQLMDGVTGGSRWLTPHQHRVTSVAFDPRGEILLSSSWDSSHRFSDPATGRILFETKDTGRVQATSDGRYFASFDDPGSISAREIIRSSIFRTLSSAATGYRELSGVDISPDARWVVSGAAEGLHVWELSSGEEVIFVPSALAGRPRFHPGGRFIVAGVGSVSQRWPFDASADPDRVRFGPPEVLLSSPQEVFAEVDFTPVGDWVAIPGRHTSFVMRWSDPMQRVMVGKDVGTKGNDYLVLSPDAQWVVGATYQGLGVRVWNARDGSMVRQLIDYDNARLALSPDGHTLATATSTELVFWETGKWQPGRRIPTGLSGGVPVPLVFNRDGSLLAVALTRQEIHLLDGHTGDLLAALTPPLPVNLMSLAFSADGRHLAAQTQGPLIHLWDLGALHQELRKLGLDW